MVAAIKIYFLKISYKMFPKSLSKITVATAITLPIMLLNVPKAFADDKRDFTVVNSTSTTLNALYLSTSGSDNWGENVLEKSVSSGESAELHYTGKSSDCLFDIKGVFSDGVETDQRQVDFCKVGTYTFHDEDQQPKTKQR